MPAIPRQLFGELTQDIEPNVSTTVGLFGPALVPTTSTSTQGPLLPSIPLVPALSTIVASPTQPTSASSIVTTPPVVPVTTTSAAPTTTPAPSTTSIEIVSTSTSDILSLTTPTVSNDPQSNVPESNTPEVVASTSALLITPSATTSASASATGVASNAGSSAQNNGGMSSGIIALVVIGALLAALLAGAFTFRRVQVYRRAKRRENNYVAAIPDNAPFPFTNVSEADLKGAQPIRDPLVSYNEKPLPSVTPDLYPTPPNPAYNQYGDSGMTGPYPAMGGSAAGYGYGQPGRASPAPSQVQALRIASPSPPPVAYTPGQPTYPYSHPQAPTPAPAPSVPIVLAAPQATGAKKRVIQTFQPTLPDELDIHEGDLVTVVHAYDDGWGLCECNGRRGVVPLECLDPGKPDFRASRRLSSLSAVRQ